MKQCISIVLISVYFTGMIQQYQTMIDFYLHRDNYTQRFCERLDEGITTCRASCYLDKLIEEAQKSSRANELIVPEKMKSPEIISQLSATLPILYAEQINWIMSRSLQSQEGISCIFHPPKEFLS